MNRTDSEDRRARVADIAAMTRELPLLLSLMGLTAKTIGPYARAFPDARGFFARLGPDEQGGAPSTRPAALLAALRGLHVRRDRGAGGQVGTRPE